MEWIVVHFIEENVVEVIPVAWLHDDLCYWPPHRLLLYVKNQYLVRGHYLKFESWEMDALTISNMLLRICYIKYLMFCLSLFY